MKNALKMNEINDGIRYQGILSHPAVRYIAEKLEYGSLKNYCYKHNLFHQRKVDLNLEKNYISCCFPLSTDKLIFRLEKSSNKIHVTQGEISSYTVNGKIASYIGGGYIETLSLEINRLKEKLEYLKDSNWVDRATRAILTEFVLFNANVNLFCNVKFLTEVSPSGGVITTSTIQPLGYFALPMGIFEMGCALTFYAIIFFYTLILYARANCMDFFTFSCSIWNILNLIIVVIGFLSIPYAVWHALYLKKILANPAPSDQYFSLDVICHWNTFFVGMMGICIFLVWIKIFQYIKFQRTILQLSKTLTMCREDLFGFTIMFMIVVIAYADLSVLLFGTVHADFRDFSTSILTMLRLILGDFNYAEIDQTHQVLAPMFFLTYILFVFFILINMFLAILNDTYSGVRSEITDGKKNNCAKYLKALMLKLRSYTFWWRRSEQDEKKCTPLKEAHNRFAKGTDPSGLNRTKRHFLDECFQILPKARTPEQHERLKQRIEILEQTLNRLSQHEDIITNKLKR